LRARFLFASARPCSLQARWWVQSALCFEGNFLIESSDDIGHNLCIVGALPGDFGEITGEGTGGEQVIVVINTMQPTSASRGTDKLSVKQSRFAVLRVDFNMAIVVSNVPIEKCSINGSFTKHNGYGSVSVRCKGRQPLRAAQRRSDHEPADGHAAEAREVHSRQDERQVVDLNGLQRDLAAVALNPDHETLATRPVITG
jgi:hypothetical protein